MAQLDPQLDPQLVISNFRIRKLCEVEVEVVVVVSRAFVSDS